MKEREGDTPQQRGSRKVPTATSETHADDRRRDLRLRKHPSSRDLRATAEISEDVPCRLSGPLLTWAIETPRFLAIFSTLFATYTLARISQGPSSASGSKQIERKGVRFVDLVQRVLFGGVPEPDKLGKVRVGLCALRRVLLAPRAGHVATSEWRPGNNTRAEELLRGGRTASEDAASGSSERSSTRLAHAKHFALLLAVDRRVAERVIGVISEWCQPAARKSSSTCKSCIEMKQVWFLDLAYACI